VRGWTVNEFGVNSRLSLSGHKVCDSDKGNFLIGLIIMTRLLVGIRNCT
jgi:hypothetical protein